MNSPRYNPAIHHRRSIRLKGYDYSQEGLYFVTLCVQDKKFLFGEIEHGKMILNKYGEIAHEEWIKTATLRKNISLDEFIIMPNHMHGIICIDIKLRKTTTRLENSDRHQTISGLSLEDIKELLPKKLIF